MKTQCPNCNSKFEIHAEYLQKTASCPVCNELFYVKEIIELKQIVKEKKKISQIVISIVGLIMVISGILTVIIIKKDIPFFVGPMCIIGFLMTFAYFTSPTPRNKNSTTHIICPNPNCGYQGEATIHNKCSTGTLVILLLLGLVPGLIYIIACGGFNNVVCPKCGIKIR